MKKLLKFMFFYVYRHYEENWPKEDPEDYAFPFLCGWVYLNMLILVLLFYSLFNIKIFVLEGNEKYLLTIPGIIIFIIGWKKLMSDEGYTEWIKPDLFEDSIYEGRSGKWLFRLLFVTPLILAILAFTLKP